jgi:hypothetical protein
VGSSGKSVIFWDRRKGWIEIGYLDSAGLIPHNIVAVKPLNWKSGFFWKKCHHLRKLLSMSIGELCLAGKSIAVE